MAEQSNRRWFGHGRTRALLAAGALLGSGAVATSAYWTSRGTVTGVTLHSGSMHIVLGSTSLDLSGMTAGTTRAGVIPVSNTGQGGAAFSYRVQGSASGTTLGPALKVNVFRGGSGSSCSGGTPIATNAPLTGASHLDVASGANLAQGASVNICFQVTLPTGSVVAGGSTSTVTFTFPATQVHP